MLKQVFLLLLTVLYSYTLQAQRLTFTKPVSFLPGATSDKAIDITNFNQHYFVTWKSTGPVGNIQVAYLGTRLDTAFANTQNTIAGATSHFAPVFRTTKEHIYLFWIATDGTLKYMVNTSPTGFENATVNSLPVRERVVFNKGISVAFAGDKMIMASHDDSKGKVFIAVSTPGKDGLLQEAAIVPVKGVKSLDYPFAVAVNNQSQARCCWNGSKDNQVCYADYDPATNTWSAIKTIPNASTATAPALYSVFADNRLFYVWKNAGKDNGLSYREEIRGVLADSETVLPDWFTTDNPVSLSYIDQDNFMMAYTGKDQQLYLSYFADYDPASWIGSTLFPAKADYRIKDIVIPGAHDAGMSVLNGTGGSGKASVNECNTLTQLLNIEKQLQNGIRMFDLRIEQYKGELYTKHAAADCMDDAMGGGYGEKLEDVLQAVKAFLHTHPSEFVILSYSHFCEKQLPIKEQAKQIVSKLGKEIVYYDPAKPLAETRLRDVAGKVIVSFENYSYPEWKIDAGTMVNQSAAFINYRRAYAATNELDKLLTAQQGFFSGLKNNAHTNDLIRLDWQLTESGSEAAFICNDFQSEKSNPLLDGALLLVNAVKHHKSIIDLSRMGNRYLLPKVMEWIDNGTITTENKPNIIYVDAAGSWVTDFCIDLNHSPLYNK